MRQGNRGLRALFALAGTALLVAVAAGCGTQSGGGNTVTVIGTWAGGEADAFLAMVKPWEDETGNKVKYTGTRDINTVLTTGVASGVLPDLAGLPGPGQMAEYAKAGALKSLDGALDANTYKSETAKALVDLGTVDGKLTGVFIKAAVKGLIWYNPAVHDYSGAPPATWDDLMSQAQANQGDAEALWCLGLGSGAASGWPGTDWIEDIVLRQAGPQVYNDWWAGKVKWTSPEIKAAFQKALVVRKLNPQARELADTYFFETLVRIHRAGEGAPYTGLKPEGRDLSPAIPAGDKAIETRSAEALLKLLTDKVHEGLHGRFHRVVEMSGYSKDDIEAGREYVKAYVEYIHYVEGLYEAAKGPAEGHSHEVERAVVHGDQNK